MRTPNWSESKPFKKVGRTIVLIASGSNLSHSDTTVYIQTGFSCVILSQLRIAYIMELLCDKKTMNSHNLLEFILFRYLKGHKLFCFSCNKSKHGPSTSVAQKLCQVSFKVLLMLWKSISFPSCFMYMYNSQIFCLTTKDM